MKRLALAFALLATTTLAIPVHAKDSVQNTLQIPVAGASAAGDVFAGTFTLQRFSTNAAGQLVAVGTIAGTVTNAGQVIGSGLQTVEVPVTVNSAANTAAVVGQAISCGILHLDLGPLSLNLLGLQINLSRVVLDITAVPGAGNLLGNLLCSVANLLNNPTGLAQLLNQIIAILQGL